MKNYYAAAYGYGSARTYQITIIDDHSLVERLVNEIAFVADQIRRSWPRIKRDPIGYSIHLARNCRRTVVRVSHEPRLMVGSLVPVALVLFGILFSSLPGRTVPSADQEERGVDITTIPLPLAPAKAPQSKSGIGAGLRGRIGFRDGKGEGSKSSRDDGRGGGGSGQDNPLPTQHGKLFLSSPIPAINKPIPKNPALPQAGIDIDPALWKAQAAITYGDPRSNSTAPSNGPGDGGNFGSGQGPGIGEGNGPGFGPGSKGNMGGGEKNLGGDGIGGGVGDGPGDPNRVVPLNQVTQRARVLMKPEPQYTEEARRNGITGSVVLRVIFLRTGEVANVRVVQSLPFGLTERAILAARQIKFSPALKDGRPVSVSMQLEYNFNLY